MSGALVYRVRAAVTGEEASVGEWEEEEWGARRDALFGRLRSLMNQDALEVATRYEVMDLLDEASRLAPGEVDEKWAPYVAGFPHHFEGVTLTFDEVEALERWARIAPSTDVVLSLRPWPRPLDLEAARRLAGSPALGRVVQLELMTEDQDVIAALMRSPHLGRLRWLSVSSDALSRRALEAMAAARFGALTDLVVPMYQADVRGVAALLGSPGLATLEHLDLHGMRYAGVEVGLGDAVARAVADATQLGRLRRLDLSYNRLTADGMEALAGAAHLSGLTHLGLSDNPLGDAGVEALSRAAWASLGSLELTAVGLSDPGAAALSGMGPLVHLDLGGEGILDEAANRIGPMGAAALAAAPNLAGLESLVLQCNPLGDEGVRALAESLHLGGLHTLDLADVSMTDEGVQALVGAPWSAGLTSLNLGYNELGDLGVYYLARAEHMNRLTELWLEECGVGDPGAQDLADAPHLGNLRLLELLYNPFTREGAGALARSPHLSEELRRALSPDADQMLGRGE
jgi:hypothetical protein